MRIRTVTHAPAFIVTFVVAGLVTGPSALPAKGHQTASSPTKYMVRTIDTLGGSFSSPIDLNASGAVVGVSVEAGDRALRGFIWRHGVVTDIGDLGGPQAAASGINSAGQVVGWADLKTPAPPSIFNTTSLLCNPPMVDGQPSVTCHAFIKDKGGLTDLGTLGGRNSAAENRGINDRGQVIGAAETTMTDPTGGASSLEFHAFIWQRERAAQGHGVMRDLGTLNGDPDSVATGINNNGVVIGISVPNAPSFNGDNGEGFVWRDKSLTALTTLGGTHAVPTALNDKGQIVGASSTRGDHIVHATLWEHNGVTDLGVLPGDIFSEATDITESGVIVGYSCSATTCRATRWDRDGMKDLNTLVSPSRSWQLNDVQAANSRGEIVGDGQHHELSRAFLLTPTH